MNVPLVLVDCGSCEGTGREINWFDPPEMFNQPITSVYDAGIELSPSGRQMYKEPCKPCKGSGLIQTPKQ